MTTNVVLSSMTRRLATLSIGSAPAVTRNASSTVCRSFGSTISSVHFPIASVVAMPDNNFGSSHVGTNLRSFSDKSGSDKNGGENVQHEAWVQFQQNIAVDGFETGAVTTFNDASGGVKRRGGKALRKRMDKLRLNREEAAGITEGGGHFPAERLSEEETQKLLAEAYSYIPERAGPRKSREKKRHFLKWEHKRQNDAKKKRERIGAHYRRSENMSRIAKECRFMRDTGHAVREHEKAYHTIVLQRWAAMHLGLDPAGDTNAVEVIEAGSE